MKDKKVIATLPLNNLGGIGIFEIIHGIEDKVKFAYFTGENYSKVTTSIIRIDNDGNPYFYSGRRKFYLNEFILTN